MNKLICTLCGFTLAVALPVSAAKPASKKLTPPSQHAATHTVAASQAASEAEEMSLASVSRTNPFEIVPAAGMELLSEPGQSEESAALTADMLGFAKRFMGTRYVHGGRSPKGFDCSGFTSYVYANFGYTLSPSSSVPMVARLGAGGNADTSETGMMESAAPMLSVSSAWGEKAMPG